MELKGSRTERNLREAFAGETQARSKYDYFASVAKKEGYEQIAAIFQTTANNEKEHAKMWFKALGGIGTTAEEFLVGVEQGLRLLPPYVKVEAAAVSETLLPEVEGRTELPLLPLTPRMTVPETGLDEG